jgi:hypothetical protein
MASHPLLNQALQSFEQLVHNLPRPSYASLIREAGIKGFTDCPFAESKIPPIKEHPSSIFREVGALTSRKVPPHWRRAFKAWRQFQCTASILRAIFADSDNPKGIQTDAAMGRLDSERAGILLTAEGAQTELGHFLFEIAVSTEPGAFLAAHAPDLRRHQIHAILEMLAINPELLFWLGQNRPAFREPSYILASRGTSLFAGLAATQIGDIKCLKALIESAGVSPMASTAALALFPRSSNAQTEQWVSKLKIAPRQQYEAIQWTRHTWYGGRWLSLREAVGAPTDKGRWWYHWCLDVHPDPAHWDLAEVDALWCAELSIDLGLPRLPAIVLERLWKNFSYDKRDLEAATLLHWSQSRRWPS